MAGAIKIVVPGDVVPWARAGGGRTMHKFTPKKQADYMKVLRGYANERMAGRPVFEGPVEIELVAVYLWRKGDSAKRRAQPDAAWKITKPDADNITKIVKDSFNSIVFRDDAQVASLLIRKLYSDRAGLIVWVRPLTGIAAPEIEW